jgi:hypothetical protein
MLVQDLGAVCAYSNAEHLPTTRIATLTPYPSYTLVRVLCRSLDRLAVLIVVGVAAIAVLSCTDSARPRRVRCGTHAVRIHCVTDPVAHL